MSTWARSRHLSSPAKSGPPPETPRRPPPPPPPKWRIWLLALGTVLTLILLFRPSTSSTPTQKLTYTDWVTQITANKVKTVTMDQNGKVSGVLTNGDHYTSEFPIATPDTTLLPLLAQHKVELTATTSSSGSILGALVVDFLPFLLFLGFFWYMGRRTAKQFGGGGLGGIMGIGGNKAKVYDLDDRPKTRFGDVAGYQGVKQEITEVVEFLKQPEKYRKAGAVGPKGVLMVGPPGTGKTLMARAVAGEAEVPFFSLTGSSFVEMFVGVGAARVRDLFADARKKAPAIIFIDEIDAIGSRRAVGGYASNDEREQTLNQLLAEMDGFDPATGVVILAATNRPDYLDPALLRPGRFDRRVEFPLPNQAEREAILRVHCTDKHLGPDVNLNVVARATPGFSGADLANLVNEAAIFAVRDGRDTITAEDFMGARDRVLLGHRDATNALLPLEKRAVAVHEGGHALVAALSDNADPVAKVTILPAGQALGVTEQLPEAERHLYPESYLYDSLAVRMGGRVGELLVLGEASTGAANDLAGATELATRMVRDWGLSKKMGPVGFSSDGSDYLGGGGDFGRGRPYAEATQRVVDEEVARLLREAEDRATVLLSAHRDALDRLVEILLEKEVIDGSEVYALVDRTPNTIEGLAPVTINAAVNPTAPSAS
ncbi:MAG TPA: ATP-dependent zinc metalloprotease FtsH [Acidimicrobiales bacterium]|nr:ATP-dependent zinc metalloprotease FtsH [Acidimicrobiales bacterium]